MDGGSGAKGHMTRRDLLRAGALGAVGIAAAGGAVGSTRARRTQGAAQGEDNGVHVDAHGMLTKGDVDTGSFDPSAFLYDFDCGEVSILPSGQTLRSYEIVAIDRDIEVAPGVFFPAWTYNGQVPGPTLRCTEGDRVRVRFVNAGSHPHTIHFHGIHSAAMDGAFEIVEPGRTFV